MEYHQQFGCVAPQALHQHRVWHGANGLRIMATCTSFAGFIDSFEINAGIELVISENNNLLLDFGKEIDSLMLDFYVQSETPSLDVDDLIECESLGLDPELFAPPPLYWLTLSGQAGTEFVPGVFAAEPSRQLLLGPFRQLTITTSQAATLRIPGMTWRSASRH